MLDFCCYTMQRSIREASELFYDPVVRSYSLKVSNSKDGTHRPLVYCPWCGLKFPTDLGGTWMDVLKAEFGIHDPIFDDADKVPEEFKTDVWWKKRGL